MYTGIAGLITLVIVLTSWFLDYYKYENAWIIAGRIDTFFLAVAMMKGFCGALKVGSPLLTGTEFYWLSQVILWGITFNVVYFIQNRKIVEHEFITMNHKNLVATIKAYPENFKFEFDSPGWFYMTYSYQSKTPQTSWNTRNELIKLNYGEYLLLPYYMILVEHENYKQKLNANRKEQM